MNSQNSIQNFSFHFKTTEQTKVEKRREESINFGSPKKSFQETLNQQEKSTSVKVNSEEAQTSSIPSQDENTSKGIYEDNDYRQEISSEERNEVSKKGTIPKDSCEKIENESDEIDYQTSVLSSQHFDIPSTEKSTEGDEEAPTFLDCSCAYATMLDIPIENDKTDLFDCEKNKEVIIPLNEEEEEVETPKASEDLCKYEEKGKLPLPAAKDHLLQTNEKLLAQAEPSSNASKKESVQKNEVKQEASYKLKQNIVRENFPINSSPKSEKPNLNKGIGENIHIPDLKNIFGIKFAAGEDKNKNLMLRTNTGPYSEKANLEAKELKIKNSPQVDSLSFKSSDYFFKTDKATNKFSTNGLAQEPQELLQKVALQKYDVANKGYIDSAQETIATLVQQMDDMKRFKRNVVQVKIELENGESVNCQLTLLADNLNIRFSSMEESFKERILQHWDMLKTTAERHHLLLQTPSFIQN